MARRLLPVLPLALAAATSLLTAPLTAQWQLVPALNPPPTRTGFTLTPMPNGELLLFGGDAANPSATEYAWNGIAWRPVTTPVPRRSGHVAGVDGDGHVVIFGGFDAASAQLLDTWTFDGTTWTQVVTANAPSNLGDMSMAFDPRGGGMVLVGVTFPPVVQTWRLAQGNWTPVASATFPAITARVYHDSVRSELAALAPGGAGFATYRLDNGAWVETSQIAVSTISGSSYASFDEERGRLVALSGGLPSAFTIESDGLHGTQFSGPTPPLSFTQAVAYHRERHETTYVVSTAPLSVWRWTPAPVAMATAHGASCVAAAFQLALAPGDSPQPGATHRLRATGPGTAITLDVLGFSHTQNGGLPLPQTIPLGALGCQLRVEAVVLSFLGVALPATQAITLPNTPTLLGARYDAQFVQLDASGVTDASNALEVQIGLPLPEHTLLETFASDASRDASASGDLWGNGVVTQVAIGGDGHHGSFAPSFGVAQGGGVFVWNVDTAGGIVIPASNTPSGQSFHVTDGRFFFTDFVLAAGTTVKFTGSVPPQIFVRGACEIRGTIDCSAVDMPATVPTTGPLAGQRVSQYNAKGSPPSVLTMGQLGGLGGPGAGSGGNGGYEPGGTSGPIFILGVNISNGQAGQTVRVSASHAYAAQTVGTGGAGSPLTPASGLGSSATVPYITVLQYRRDFSRGGGGGGFMLAGGAPTLPTISPATLLQPVAGPAVAGGVLFALLPFPATPPPGYQSLNHFLVGGSGGGGGGAHNFSTANLLETAVGTMFVSGAGGTGGGGAIALRAGGDLTMFPTGSVLVRGGRGVVINGDDLASGTQDVNFGVSSPGGGGSGGSVLLQSAHDIAVSGLIDASGSTGSRTSNIAATSAPVEISVVSQAGAGSDGYYRLEAALGASFTGTGVPAFNPATNSGSLADVDARTGSRSLWLLPATSALPYWLRYELIADVGGQTLLFSDDPAVSPLAANDPAGAVQLRFQGARLDPVTGQPVASTIGPWRAQLAPSLSSVNGDRATAVRFDLVVDKSQGPVVVRELRLVWR